MPEILPAYTTPLLFSNLMLKKTHSCQNLKRITKKYSELIKPKSTGNLLDKKVSSINGS